MKTYDTKDIDQAAFLASAYCTFPTIFRDQFDGRATFEFEQCSKIHAALVEYATGSAVINARHLLATRRHLYHEIRKVTAGGAA